MGLLDRIRRREIADSSKAEDRNWNGFIVGVVPMVSDPPRESDAPPLHYVRVDVVPSVGDYIEVAVGKDVEVSEVVRIRHRFEPSDNPGYRDYGFEVTSVTLVARLLESHVRTVDRPVHRARPPQSGA